MKKRYSLILIIIVILISTKSWGQDGHYWTQQYGTRSMLMSGSVIGGVEDLGAVYYNPGRLAVISNAAFLLSASVYEYSKLTVSDPFGNATSASKSEFKGVPTLAAGTFKLKKLPKHFFAYAILTRQNSDLTFGFQNEVKKDVFPAIPGEETFGAQASFSQLSNEQWIGVTWSYLVTPKISVGVTTNYTINSQSRSGYTNLQSLFASNDVAVYRYSRSYSYKQTGLLWKLGLAATMGKWKTGLTITTPQLNFSGSGTYSYEEFIGGASAVGVTDTYSSSYQDNLMTHYKTPLSIGVGASRDFGRNRLYLSAEWYSGTSKYSVMDARPHVSQSNTNDTIRFTLLDQAKQVFNFGAGMEFYLSEKVSGFASFSTDMTSVPDNIDRFVARTDAAYTNSWNVDFFHVGGGVVLKLKGADITLGATHTGAKQTIPRPVSFPDGSGTGIFDPTQTADLNWDRWRFVFSFSIPFFDQYAKKLTNGL